MLIKKLKNIAGGVTLLEPLMGIGIIMVIIIGIITYYNAATKKADSDFIDIVNFGYLLNEVHSDKDSITLKYNEIVPFQQDLFKKLDCTKLICKPFDLIKYPPNTYLSISYKNSNFESFKIYTKISSSIFEFTDIPYNDWVSKMPYSEFTQQQEILVKKELKRNPKLNPIIVNLTKLFDNISIYKALDSDGSIVTDSYCPESTCSSILEYKHKSINSTLITHK